MTSAPYVVAILLLTGALALPAEAARPDPDALVRETVTDVLSAINQTRDKRALHRLAEEKVLPMFDFIAMTRFAIGRHWRDASPSQQVALESGFRTLLVNTYVTALTRSDAGNASVEIKPAQPQGGPGDVLVRTVVSQHGSKPVRIDYRMHDAGGAWKVNDVLVEQLSLLSVYRDAFSDILARSGIDGLIRQIADKNGATAGS